MHFGIKYHRHPYRLEDRRLLGMPTRLFGRQLSSAHQQANDGVVLRDRMKPLCVSYVTTNIPHVTGVEAIASDKSRGQCRSYTLPTLSTLGCFAHLGIRLLKGLDQYLIDLCLALINGTQPLTREVFNECIHRERTGDFPRRMSTQAIGDN
jgi:hypothetical protein